MPGNNEMTPFFYGLPVTNLNPNINKQKICLLHLSERLERSAPR